MFILAVRAIREYLSPKPNIYAYELDRWTKRATELRDIAVGIMDDKINEEQFYDKLDELTHYGDLKFTYLSEDEIVKHFAAYREVGHDYDFTALDFL